jgi:hypothetical protein
MASEQEHYAAAQKYQEYYDNVLRKVGMRAPQPTLGQKVNDYRVETLRMMKRTFLPQNHPLYKVNYRGLRDDSATISAFEPQLLNAVPIEAYNPAHVPPGEKEDRTLG